ncbi:MAG: hypothetical protein L0271_21125 [Gemmatimonadetes bacterium]|nr:hypothetical protein [Gemmatimonadota bacterium]
MASGSKGAIGTVLAVVAIAGTAGLMFWLAGASAPTTVANVQEGAAGPAAERVLAGVFETSMTTYVGREIELAGVRVEQVMTPEILWVALPGSQLFMVKLTPQAATSPAPALQSMVDVTGLVLIKTDSMLNAWQQSGAIQDAGQRAQAEFGTTFIEATRVVPAAGG